MLFTLFTASLRVATLILSNFSIKALVKDVHSRINTRALNSQTTFCAQNHGWFVVGRTEQVKFHCLLCRNSAPSSSLPLSWSCHFFCQLSGDEFASMELGCRRASPASRKWTANTRHMGDDDDDRDVVRETLLWTLLKTRCSSKSIALISYRSSIGQFHVSEWNELYSVGFKTNKRSDDYYSKECPNLFNRWELTDDALKTFLFFLDQFNASLQFLIDSIVIFTCMRDIKISLNAFKFHDQYCFVKKFYQLQKYIQRWTFSWWIRSGLNERFKWNGYGSVNNWTN